MKKIVQAQARTIELGAINNDSIVGIDWQEQGKTFLIATSEGYKPLSRCLSVTHSWDTKSVREAVEYVFKAGGDAYIFDTKEDLFRWLGE